jgi:branched-chain amino acid aminotransferase
MHRYLLHNGEIRGTGEALLSPGQVGFMNGWGIFTTMRVAQGVLFAFERHYARMQRDAERMRVPFDLSPAELETSLQSLIAANHAFEATLRVCVVRNRGGMFEGSNITRATDLVAFTADINPWGAGVKLSYVPHGRHGASPFAGRKVTSWAQNLTWYEDAHERGFDEVILLSELGQVSECTSANIFAIYDDQVYTPPLETSGCLPGVTRAILLEEIRVPAINIAERELSPSDLEAADQVFITSTTRDLLPVLEIDRLPLTQRGDVLNHLRQAFLSFRSASVAKNSRKNEIFAA